MKMQPSALFIALIFQLSLLIVSCSPTRKEMEEEERIYQVRLELKHIENNANGQIQKSKTAKEWALLSFEYELIIENNEMRIEELKQQIEASNGEFSPLITRQLEELEHRNAEIKEKLATKDASQSDWVRFQMEIDDEIALYRKAFREIKFN